MAKFEGKTEQKNRTKMNKESNGPKRIQIIQVRKRFCFCFFNSS